MTWTPGATVDAVEQGAFPVFPGFWSGVTFPHQATALNPETGNYQYAVKFRPQNPAIDRGWNAFKIRTFGTAVLLGNQVVAFLGAMNFPNDLPTMYPNLVLNPPNNDYSGSPYDGTWTFKFRLPPFLGDVTVFDGDMDFGNTGCDYRDTDDPDTDNVATPPFSPNAAPEGVASYPGGGCITGLPADDSQALFFKRQPILTGVPDGIAYQMVAPATPANPTGQIFLNRNPSGNREWEQFKIQLVTNSADVTNGACPVEGYPASPGFTLPDNPTDRLYPASDCRTADLPGGVWDIQLDGMDLQNLNFWFFSFKVEPIETEYSIGRLVWYDTNKNGQQDLADPTEIGIPDVTYTVYDGPGPGANVVRQGSTDANGEFLETGLPAGDYTVVVDAANLAPGGPLFGWTSTTGGEVENGVEVGLPICVDTNVPAGCGQPLYEEAIFGYVGESGLECIITPPGGGSIVGATHTWTTNGDGSITLRTTVTKQFTDNTYGANGIGWNNHTFKHLVQSDHIQMSLFDNANAKKLEFRLDYISKINGAPGGHASAGVSGGDGGMVLGAASNIVSADSSLAKNFRDGMVLTVDSTATDASYTPNPAYPNWIFEVWYEVTFRPEIFGGSGFGYPRLTGMHSSPSKTGRETEICVYPPQ
jgi:hypothetical protein